MINNFYNTYITEELASRFKELVKNRNRILKMEHHIEEADVDANDDNATDTSEYVIVKDDEYIQGIMEEILDTIQMEH